MIKYQDAIHVARSLLGMPYAQLDCINLIKKVIRVAPGGVPGYTTAGTNALWRSYDSSAKYRDLTWRQMGIAGAKPGMLAFKIDGENIHHVGIVTDIGTVIHSSSAQGKVVETALDKTWDAVAIHRYIDIAEEEAPMYKAQVNLVSEKSSLNLRNGPSTTDRVIGSIPHGSVVDVLAEADSWLYVRYNGTSGYASSQYLMRVGEDIPEEEETPEVPASDVTIIDEAGNEWKPVGSFRVLIGGID